MLLPYRDLSKTVSKREGLRGSSRGAQLLARNIVPIAALPIGKFRWTHGEAGMDADLIGQVLLIKRRQLEPGSSILCSLALRWPVFIDY